MLERLESRRLMAAGFSASQAGSQLAVSGQDITVYENPQVAQQVIARDNSTGSELTFNGITDVAITGSVSVDRIFFTGYTVNSKIFGGGGSDLITVSDEGTTAKSEVNGEGADDTITVLHSNDTKIVGDGGGDQIYINDSVKDSLGSKTTYIYGSGGNDVITIYAGINYVDGGSGGQDLLIDASNGTAVIISTGVENFA